MHRPPDVRRSAGQGAPREMVQLGCLEPLNNSRLQAERLAARYRLPLPTARLIACLLYGDGRAA